MLLLGLDLETTGLAIGKVSVTEVGLVLWDTDLHTSVKSSGFLVDPGYNALWEEGVESLNGITPELCSKYGVEDERAVKETIFWCKKAEVICAHNGEKFDRPLLKWWAEKYGLDWEPHKLWINTKCDLPTTASTRLTYMAADHGFLNPFPHRAVFDVMAMLKILDCYDINQVIEVAKSPSLDVRALVDYDNREKAKTRGFHWEADVKQWKLTVKECHLEREREACKAAGFDIEVLNVV